MKCKKCDIDINEDDAIVDRDGDPYDPETNFWYICPYCLEPLEESEEDV